ncbi:hypothetical protein PHYPSEUDO_012910 [Phytophthora pseudosyringae]|uniref:PH domain-containing protein n=1 Tax=Phytophthora pseudosyringae TaxID=221518 RepID=A0A8T1W2Z5_9STRA|nr:hypothetical protein PHYPSEUDO_012910 [Phytophthora pseudosyringae]
MVRSSSSEAATFLSTTSTQRSTLRTSSTLSSATETLKDWLYWQRDGSKSHCWTKVYGVIDNEFLWLFNGKHSNRTMVLKIAVSSVKVSTQRQLHVIDPSGEEVEIWTMDEDSFAKWRLRLEEAAALTAQFFRMIEINARQLPRTSTYRGSLVTRTKKRARCKALFVQLVSQWRHKKDGGERDAEAEAKEGDTELEALV